MPPLNVNQNKKYAKVLTSNTPHSIARGSKKTLVAMAIKNDIKVLQRWDSDKFSEISISGYLLINIEYKKGSPEGLPLIRWSSLHPQHFITT